MCAVGESLNLSNVLSLREERLLILEIDLGIISSYSRAIDVFLLGL